VGWPIVLASLLLGYRRFFWLAAGLCLLPILVIATRKLADD
jgi:hypothetical protein